MVGWGLVYCTVSRCDWLALAVCLSVSLFFSKHLFTSSCLPASPTYLPPPTPPHPFLSLARTVRRNTCHHLTTQSTSAPSRVALPPKSNGTREGNADNAPLLRNRTVNGSAAHPLPYGSLAGGNGTGSARASNRWAPADGWDGVVNGTGDSGGDGGLAAELLEASRVPGLRMKMTAQNEALYRPAHAEGGPVGDQDATPLEENEEPVPERFSEFSRPGTGARTEAGTPGDEEKEAVYDPLPFMLASLERVALTVNDLQGRCARLSNGESWWWGWCWGWSWGWG